MSKTDKTKPSHVRLREIGAKEYPGFYRRRSAFDAPRDFKWSYAERGIGPKHVRWAKRMRSKKNRRSALPLSPMTGRGWGEENIRSYWP